MFAQALLPSLSLLLHKPFEDDDDGRDGRYTALARHYIAKASYVRQAFLSYQARGPTGQPRNSPASSAKSKGRLGGMSCVLGQASASA